MRHPLRDLPSLLVRFGAIPKPLEGRNVPLEWEEWPGGDEAAVKFPVNRKERCFGLGIVEERGEAPEKLTQDPPQHTSEAGRDGRRAKDAEGQGGSHEGEWSMARGIAEAGGGGRSARRRDSKAIELGGWEKSLKSKARAIAEEFPTADVRVTVLPPPRRKLPIVRCLADVDFLVEVTGSLMDPPACAHCKACSADFMLYVCTVALIANFAYRPLSHLFSRVLSLFPPPSLGFDELVDCLEFPARLHWPLNLHMLLRRAKQVPVYFLVHMAIWCAHPLLEKSEFKGRGVGAAQGVQSGASEGGGKEGGEGGRVEVQGRWDSEESQENGGEVWEEVRMWYSAVMAEWRFDAEGKGESKECRGSREQEWTDEECDITWLLDAAISPSIRAAAVPDMEGRACSSIVTLGSDPAACGGRLCGAAGCERVEGDGVKFKNCSGCGKVAYCSRECQKAHWPSHKLTCPGRISGKRSGKDESKECGRKTDEESCCEGSAKRVGAGRCGDGG
ncbi:unnamed protein product [Closterium sp. Naga37s-1]|nr:unnamed protein product [Closterium sp. Naga37s-1]